MNKKLLFFVWSVMLFSANQTFGQIVLASGQTATHYVEKIIGQGIMFSDAVIIGDVSQIATYTGGAGGGFHPEMNNGLIMGTGSVNVPDYLQGSSSINRSQEMGTTGFSELNALSGGTTFDGIGLEFKIIPLTDDVRINFMFGSEEYNEWVNTTYNDVFGFFISGPGVSTPYPGQNIAVAPNGARVCTNTINRGRGCPATYTTVGNPAIPCPMGSNNCATNPFYYIDNCTGAYNNVMDGFTIMLQAQATVIPCEEYTIRLLLADFSDQTIDSWVMLQEGGFYADGPRLNAHVEYAYGGTSVVEGCSGSQLLFCLDEPLFDDFVIDIHSVTGTATSGVDYLPFLPQYTIPAGETCITVDIVALLDGAIEGIETIIIEYQKDVCNIDEIVIEIDDPYDNCCYPNVVFDAPTGEEQQTLSQGQTLADLVVNGEAEADYFVWYSDINLTTEIPATTQAVNQTTYYVVQVISGCESEALAITVEVTASNIIFDGQSFTAYPNPVRDIFNISYNNEITGIEVINMLGQTLISETKNATDVQIDMSALPKGNYFVKVKTDEMTKVIKVVKQ